MHEACTCPNHPHAGRERSRPAWISRQLALPLIALVKLYQFTLSPVLGRQCRFLPTCSWYALDALRQHGALTGGLLAVRRLSRCHPLSKGGIDPVPADAMDA